VNTAADELMMNRAIAFADQGLRVFPLHEPVARETCSCREKAECGSVGKHPRIKDGFKAATVDTEQIKKWWERWPTANIGVATGGGLFVLDVDFDHDGDRSLADLEVEHGELSDEHPRVNTGNGVHYYFKIEGEVRNSASKVAPGLDIRGDGGYVVGSGSTHGSGTVYTHDLGSGTSLISAPEWLEELVVSTAPKLRLVEPSNPEDVPKGGRNNYLTSEGGKLRRTGFDKDTIFSCLISINKKFSVPLGEKEVDKIAASVARYEPVPSDGTWQGELKLDRHRNVKKVPGNAVLIMSRHELWEGVLGFNEMRQRVVWLKLPPGNYDMPKPKIGEQLADWHIPYVQHWFDKSYSISFSHEVLIRCIASAAQTNTFHPVREYLENLSWDGKPRVEKWLSDYMGASDNPYNNLTGRCWLISAVARVMIPGCQADHVLVLEGPQGSRKSTGMAALFGYGDDWYMESLPELTQGGGKDAMASLAGPWCIEIAELDAIRGKASTKTKDFISRRVDEYRPSYGRCHVRLPRQCVFVGTTNQTAWLTDPTGGRRFWPCKVGKIDRDGIIRDRDQIWAEAFQHYVDGTQWWPTDEFTSTLVQEQEARFSTDVWEDAIVKWISDKKEVDVLDVYIFALEIDRGRISRSDQTRVGNILVRLGYEKFRKYQKRVRYTYYRKVHATTEEPSQSSPSSDE